MTGDKDTNNKDTGNKDTKELIIFKEITHSENLITRVYRDLYKGKEILSVRKFFKDKETGEFLPGKGVTLNHEDIDEIIEGLQTMLAWCEADITDEQIENNYYIG